MPGGPTARSGGVGGGDAVIRGARGGAGVDTPDAGHTIGGGRVISVVVPGARRHAPPRGAAAGPGRPGLRRAMGGDRGRQRLDRRHGQFARRLGRRPPERSGWSTPRPLPGRGGPQRRRRPPPRESSSPSATPTTWSRPGGWPACAEALRHQRTWRPAASTSGPSTATRPAPPIPGRHPSARLPPRRPRGQPGRPAGGPFDEVGGFDEDARAGRGHRPVLAAAAPGVHVRDAPERRGGQAGPVRIPEGRSSRPTPTGSAGPPSTGATGPAGARPRLRGAGKAWLWLIVSLPTCCSTGTDGSAGPAPPGMRSAGWSGSVRLRVFFP